MPRYKDKKYEAALESLEQLPQEDCELVKKFNTTLSSQGLSKGRRNSYLRNLIRLRRDYLDVSFEDVGKENIEKILAELNDQDLSEWTVHDYKVALKRFYKWLRGNDEEYPDCVDWISTTISNSNNKLPRDSLLDKEEIEDLIQSADNPRDRAIISVLAEAGPRASELLSLNVGHARFDQHGALVTVSGKTGDRTVRLVASAPDLSNWLDNHPDRDNPDAPLFVNIGVKNKGERMSYNALENVLKKVKENSEVEKRVHAHGFRHTAATRLAKDMTEAELCEYFGWVQGSKMASTYVHMASRDTDKAMLRIHGLISEEEAEEEKLTAIECIRCGTENSPGANFCANCSLPLSEEVAREIEEKEEKTVSKFAELKDEDLMEMLDVLSRMKKLAEEDEEVAKKLEELKK